MSAPLHPHGPLRQLHDSLYVVDGGWGRSPLGRRMTVVKDDRGRLALHSAIRLEETGLAALDALGEPAWILVPNRFHGSEAAFYATRHPSARVLVPRDAVPKLRPLVPRVDGTLEEARETDLPVEILPLRGTRMHEVAFFHAASRTLVLTDLCFNLRAADLPPVARLLMHANGALDRFGPTRLLRLAFVSDRAALAASLIPILQRDVDRVIVSHGRVLETGGAAALRESFSWLPRHPADVPPRADGAS